MPKVEFLQTCLVRDGTGTTFAKGKVYELPQKSCDHWTRRGKAKEVVGNRKVSEPTITQEQEVKVPLSQGLPPLGGGPEPAKITPEEAFPDE